MVSPHSNSPDPGVTCEEWVERREELLDEALKESFPASDPPSIARPHFPLAPPQKKE